MRLRYAFLCEYAAPMATGGPLAVGILDSLVGERPTPGVGSITVRPLFMVAAFEAPGGSGPRQVANIEFVDADGHIVFGYETTFDIRQRSVGAGMWGTLVVGIRPFEIPAFGVYSFAIKVGGLLVGDVSLEILNALDLAARI